jgi:hypothetical protein
VLCNAVFSCGTKIHVCTVVGSTVCARLISVSMSGLEYCLSMMQRLHFSFCVRFRVLLIDDATTAFQSNNNATMCSH